MGQGFATEAVSALIDYAFWQRGKSRVIAWADARNAASCALLNRLCFETPVVEPRRSWFKGTWSEETFQEMTAERWRSVRTAITRAR